MPQDWIEKPPLANWVMNLRSFTRRLDRGEPSPGMMVVRAAKLDALGFWRSHGAPNQIE